MNNTEETAPFDSPIKDSMITTYSPDYVYKIFTARHMAKKQER